MPDRRYSGAVTPLRAARLSGPNYPYCLSTVRQALAHNHPNIHKTPIFFAEYWMIWTDCDSTTGGDPDKPVETATPTPASTWVWDRVSVPVASIDATVARLFGVAHLLDDDALWVELRTPGRPDGGSDHDPLIRQRLPDEVAPLGHRGSVPSLRPFLT
jgi:hypothetical protein